VAEGDHIVYRLDLIGNLASAGISVNGRRRGVTWSAGGKERPGPYRESEFQAGVEGDHAGGAVAAEAYAEEACGRGGSVSKGAEAGLR
jgi:hypothetical protein